MDRETLEDESIPIIPYGICYFCHLPLKQTSKMHSTKDYIYQCNSCNPKTEHIFYDFRGEVCLTLRTKLEIKDKEYLLYLYPTYYPQVLLQLYKTDRPIEILQLRTMKGFTGTNLQAKVERLLNLKAFL